MASHKPHSPAIRKKVILASGLGFQTSKVTIKATCNDNDKHITGVLPVILIIPPIKIDANPLQTPKQIITKPMLLIPQPQETNA